MEALDQGGILQPAGYSEKNVLPVDSLLVLSLYSGHPVFDRVHLTTLGSVIPPSITRMCLAHIEIFISLICLWHEFESKCSLPKVCGAA